MSTEQIWQTSSSGLNDTLAIAEQIGRKLQGGEVLALASDLGGGKTSFVRGLAKGMGSHDTVRSPSFTIENQYRAGKLTLHHFDFYRLHDPGIMRNELAEVINDPRAVVVIEWADIVDDVLPQDTMHIKLQAVSETGRQLIVTYPEKLHYLIDAEH